MLTGMILVVLAYCFYAGYRRGVWLQSLHLLGYAISLVAAVQWYQPLSAKLTLWFPYPSATEASRFVFFTNAVGLTLDQAFYRGIAFVIILALGGLITRFLMLWVHDLTFVGKNPLISGLVGGSLNLVVGYTGLFFLLYLVALIPVPVIQDALGNSGLSRLMVGHTVGLTQWLTHLWITI